MSRTWRPLDDPRGIYARQAINPSACSSARGRDASVWRRARRGEARRSAHGGERGHDGCDCTGVQERLEEEARAPEGGGRGTGRHGRAGRRRSQGRRIGGEEGGGIAGIAGGSHGAARLIGRIEYLVWQSHCGRGKGRTKVFSPDSPF